MNIPASLHLSSEHKTSEQDSEDKENSEDKEVKPESLSPDELEKLKEAVDEKKKLIQSLRGKPWPMKKKLVTLRYFYLLPPPQKKKLSRWSRKKVQKYLLTDTFLQGVSAVSGEIRGSSGERKRQETLRIQSHDDQGEWKWTLLMLHPVILD